MSDTGVRSATGRLTGSVSHEGSDHATDVLTLVLGVPPDGHVDGLEALGRSLALSEWLEDERASIEAQLPAFDPPTGE